MGGLSSHLGAQIDGGESFFWHRIRSQAVASHLPEDRPTSLLDVGAGAGILGRCLARSRPRTEYYFIEPLPDLELHLEAEFGKARNARRRSDLSDMAVVTLLDVVEHVDDDAAMLKSLVARLARNTRVLVTVPALDRLWSSWDEALGHRRRYERHQLASLLSAGGLRVDHVSYLFPELLPAAWLRRRRSPGSLAPGAASTPRDDEYAAEEFPRLPEALNQVLYGVGLLSLKVRRWAPAGTSLLAVGTVTDR